MVFVLRRRSNAFNSLLWPTYCYTKKAQKSINDTTMLALGFGLHLEKFGSIKVLDIESKIRGFIVQFIAPYPHSIMLYLLNC